MFETIKNWYFYKAFITDKKPKASSPHGVNPGKRIGILFNGSSEDDRKKIHKIKKRLNPDGSKNIKSLAYLNNQLPLDNVDYAAYNNKNVKWYGLPFGDKVEEFLQSGFDILIVLCDRMLPHYEYIIAHSDAQFIIGSDIKKADKYFHFIIESGPNWEIDIILDKMVKNLDKISVK